MTIVEVITISIRNRAIYFHDSFFFLFFFFLTRVEIVLRIFDAIFFVSTSLLHFTIRMEYMRNIGQNILENNV